MGLTLSMPRISVPYYPMLRSGEASIVRPKRLTPEAALNLDDVIKQLAREVLFTFDAGGTTWAVVSVLHPYTATPHVMLLDVSGNRYVPGPESIQGFEGDLVFRVAALAAQCLCRNGFVDRCCVGYNWSPYSWGEGLEEHGGFQSVPTLFHLMLWGWGPLPEEGKQWVFNDSIVEWVKVKELDARQYRMLVANDYGRPFGAMMAREIEKTFAQSHIPPGPLTKLLDPSAWRFDERGLIMPFEGSVCKLLGEHQEFFSRVIRPIGLALDNLLVRLSGVLTTLDCRSLGRLLRRVEQGPLSDANLELLRAVPTVRPEDEIREAFRREGWPAELLPVLLPAVHARCEAASQRDVSSCWRKGFGYALAMSSAPSGGSGELRIMPGVYLGPGGVVEAQGMLLSRVPIDAPAGETRRRSRMLLDLGRWLSTEFTP
ncbi:MAG: hypothetical protein NTY38_24830 [Acidobacteria bacterium]|nr:hypothetical protein [Acidobacteriota bacterium]